MYTHRILIYSALIILIIEFIASISLAADQQRSNDSQSFVIETNDSGLNATISKYPFFVLDYYAPGCEPCESMNSTIYQLSSELNGQAAFGKINTATNRITARRLGIEYYPTILIFDNGTLIHRETGYVLKSDLVKALKRIRPGLNTSLVSITPDENAPENTIENTAENATATEDVTGNSAEAKTKPVASGSIQFAALGSEKPELPMQVNDSNLEFAKTKYPFFIVMGYADWCGYCKMMNSTIQDLAGELNGQAAFGLINAETNKKTASEYNITAFPRFIIFKDGKPVRIIVGYQQKPSFVRVLKDLEPGLDISQTNVTLEAKPAVAVPKAEIIEENNTSAKEADPALDYLDKILTVARTNQTSGTTINIFIINACPKAK